MTKIFILILFTFSCLGCNNSPKSEKSIPENKLFDKENYLFSDLSYTNGVFHKDEIDENLVLVFDTITSSNYCNWIDVDSKSIKGYFKAKGDFVPRSYKYLRPSRIFIKGVKEKNDLFWIGGKKFVLPMECEEEITNYINWIEVGKDSVMFLGCIRPNIVTKNSSTRILKHFYANESLYLISKLEGAEGGANWESISICKVENNISSEITKVEIGYVHDEGDWANLTYEIGANEVKVYEERKKLELVDNEWSEVNSDKKLKNTMKF